METQQLTSPSLTASPLEQLALVAGHMSEQQQSEPNSRNSDTMEVVATNLGAESTTNKDVYHRPGSPSDAILIKRTSITTLRVNTEDLTGYQQQ